MKRGPFSPNDLSLEGANIEAKDGGVDWVSLNNSLVTAAKAGNNEAVLQALWDGAYMEARDGLYWTPLMHAAHNGHIATVEVLLEHGAELEAKNNEGCTALMLAAKHGHIAVAEALLRLQQRDDAPLEAKEARPLGRMPLHAAKNKNVGGVKQKNDEDDVTPKKKNAVGLRKRRN